MSWYYDWKPYVPVAKRKANAKQHAAKIAKKEGRSLQPIELAGSKIAATFWGKAWCDNLEQYSDYANRLPRGRTYVRNGSVIDLGIKRGQIDAMVSGSAIYTIKIKIDTLKPAHWERVKKDCASSIGSLMQLLTGKFDKDVMARLAQKDDGLFPSPKEISMRCSCPDHAGLCKHLAAVLYGIGSRLDAEPELLVTLRDVDHLDLVGQAVSADNLDSAFAGDGGDTLKGQDLGAVFGIDLSGASSTSTDAVPGPTVAKKKEAKSKKGSAKAVLPERKKERATKPRGTKKASARAKKGY